MRQYPQQEDILPPPPFGASCLFIETSAQTVTSNEVTYQTHLTLTSAPTVLPAGDYFLAVRAYAQSTVASTNGDAQLRLLQDGSPIIDQNLNQGQGTTWPIEGDSATMFAMDQIRTLAQGTHTWVLQVRKGPGGGGTDFVALHWACIEVWSFN